MLFIILISLDLTQFDMSKDVNAWKQGLDQAVLDGYAEARKKTEEIFPDLNYKNLWTTLCVAVKKSLSEDPHGLVGKDFGIRWIALVNLAYGANKELRQSIWGGLHDSKSKSQVTERMMPEVVEWIEKAIEFHNLD